MQAHEALTLSQHLGPFGNRTTGMMQVLQWGQERTPRGRPGGSSAAARSERWMSLEGRGLTADLPNSSPGTCHPQSALVKGRSRPQADFQAGRSLAPLSNLWRRTVRLLCQVEEATLTMCRHRVR